MVELFDLATLAVRERIWRTFPHWLNAFRGENVFKTVVRAIALVLVGAILSGCAEINRRGGIIDELEDAILFKADTKTHRLLRSYLLATVLLTAARRQGHNEIDRVAISGALEGALAVANEAYVCLYPGQYKPIDDKAVKIGSRYVYPLAPNARTPNPLSADFSAPPEIVDYSKEQYPISETYLTNFVSPRICQFFDEKMARLDYALYRLAEVTLFNEKSRERLGDIRTKLIGKIPVLSDAAVAAIHANKAANQLTTVLDDLLNLAFNSFGPLLALLPLYRDSVELNMWVIADNLRLNCYYGVKPRTNDRTFAVDAAAEAYSLTDPCGTFAYQMQIMKRGNGNLKQWLHFTDQINQQISEYQILPIEAYRPHFLLVAQLLVPSCRNVLSDGANPTRCETVLGNALELAAFNIDNATGQGTDKRLFLASLPLPGARFVLDLPRRSRPSNGKSDNTATGSIKPAPAKPASPVPEPQ